MRFSNKENAIIRHNSHENRMKAKENAKNVHSKKIHSMEGGFVPSGTSTSEEEIDIFVAIWSIAIVTVVGVLLAADGWLAIIAENAAIL